jgi:hypothetical protein
MQKVTYDKRRDAHLEHALAELRQHHFGVGKDGDDALLLAPTRRQYALLSVGKVRLVDDAIRRQELLVREDVDLGQVVLNAAARAVPREEHRRNAPCSRPIVFGARLVKVGQQRVLERVGRLRNHVDAAHASRDAGALVGRRRESFH